MNPQKALHVKKNKEKIMRNRVFGLALTSLVIVTPTAYARSTFGDGTAIDLIEACQAATEIFNARNEKRLLASQRTSLSDALRAGYCLGAVEHYRCPLGSHLGRSSFDAARRIASLDVNQPGNIQASTGKVLQHGACN